MPARSSEFVRFERIERRRGALLDRLRSIGDEELNQSPRFGGWSIAQVLSHVTTAEARSLSYVRHKLEKPGELHPAGLSAAIRSTLLSLGLVSPLRFKAPAVAGEVPPRVGFAEIETTWAETRAGWKTLLDEFPEDAVGLAVFRHPYAGRLTLGQTLRFVDNHEAHHERQIDRISVAISEGRR